MTESRADRDAFNEIENRLRSLLQKGKHVGFKTLVREQAERQLEPVQTHKDELKDLSDLRNAIVHNPRKE